jgi:hypothetical protein
MYSESWWRDLVNKESFAEFKVQYEIKFPRWGPSAYDSTYSIFRKIFEDAIVKGNLEIVKFFVGRLSNLNENVSVDIVCQAGVNGHLPVLKYLVCNRFKFLTEHNYFLDEVAGNGHLDVLKYYIHIGLDEKRKKSYMLTSATYGNHLPVIKYLVKKGYDYKYDNNEAFVVASGLGFLHIARYFLNLGCDPESIYTQAFLNAIENKRTAAIKFMLTYVDVSNVVDICYRMFYKNMSYSAPDYKIFADILANMSRKNQYHFLSGNTDQEMRKLLYPNLILNKQSSRNNFFKSVLRPQSLHIQMILFE